MSKVFFISDLHLGHRSICKFSGPLRGGFTEVDDHDNWIVEQWNKVVTKHDLVWVLGDACFDRKKMPLFKRMNGAKHLILGNHDEFGIQEYLKYFNKVHGFLKYKGTWLSHAPINPLQLRGKWNIHGHVHAGTLDDLRYINVAVEALNGIPISWDTLQAMMNDRRILLELETKLNDSTVAGS